MMDDTGSQATQRTASADGPFADLARLESLVPARRGEAAFAELARLLWAIERSRSIPPLNLDGEGFARFATRLTLAATQLLCDPSTRLPAATYEKLADTRQVLGALYRLAGLGDSDHVLEIIAARSGSSVEECFAGLEGDELAKFLLAASLDTRFDLPWRRILAHAPDRALPMWLSLIRTRIVLTEKAEERRIALLRLGDAAAQGALTNASVRSLRRAWMLCSYATSPDRHEVKVALNRLMAEFLARNGFRSRDLPRPRALKARPILLVGAEMLRSDHAMFRCYATYFTELRRAFTVVLAAQPGAVDKTTLGLFDRFIEVRDLPQIARALAELAPDLIFYPSLGMENWTVMLASLRLAPIQMASVGHPASARLPHLDYMVMGTALFGGAEYFSETVMLLRSAGNLYVPHPATPEVAPQVRERPDPLRIAVVSKVLKLNAPFLALCRRLRERAPRRVQFVFFPSEVGLSHLRARHEILRWLPDAVVHPGAPYAKYLANLMACDMRLATFPFGGANSNVDGFLLGIPAVVYCGGEPQSRTDYRLTRLIGQPDWLAAKTPADFEAAALRLIGDDETRVAVARAILAADPRRAIFAEPSDFHPGDYLDLFTWIYRNHEMIGASGRKVWTWEDRARADAARSPERVGADG